MSSPSHQEMDYLVCKSQFNVLTQRVSEFINLVSSFAPSRQVESASLHAKRLARDLDASLRTCLCQTPIRACIQYSSTLQSLDQFSTQLDTCMGDFELDHRLPPHSWNWNDALEQARVFDSREFKYNLELVCRQLVMIDSRPGGDDPNAQWANPTPGEIEDFVSTLLTEMYSLPTTSPLHSTLSVSVQRISEKHRLASLPMQRFDNIEITTSKPISSSCFEDTYLGTLPSTGERVAVKNVLHRFPDSSTQKRLQNELKKWSQLQHPSVHRFMGLGPPLGGDMFVSTVHPWASYHPDVLTFLGGNPTLDRRKFLLDIAEGLEYLHSRGILHGDLKPSNVLVTRSGTHTAVLTNFGLAQIASSALSVNSTIGRIPRDPRFAAPELLDSRIGAGVTEKTDVYSFGMTMFQLITSSLPFSSYMPSQLPNLIISGTRPSRPPLSTFSYLYNDELWELTERCWRGGSRDRSEIRTIVHVLRGGSQQKERFVTSRRLERRDSDADIPHSYECEPAALQLDSSTGVPITLAPIRTNPSVFRQTDFSPKRLLPSLAELVSNIPPDPASQPALGRPRSTSTANIPLPSTSNIPSPSSSRIPLSSFDRASPTCISSASASPVSRPNSHSHSRSPSLDFPSSTSSSYPPNNPSFLNTSKDLLRYSLSRPSTSPSSPLPPLTGSTINNPIPSMDLLRYSLSRSTPPQSIIPLRPSPSRSLPSDQEKRSVSPPRHVSSKRQRSSPYPQLYSQQEREPSQGDGSTRESSPSSGKQMKLPSPAKKDLQTFQQIDGLWYCDWPDCTKVFGRIHDCRRHYIGHTGAQTYNCDLCRKSFNRSDAYIRHMRSKAHVSEFNYRHCKSCDRVFECHRTLVDHLAQHGTHVQRMVVF